MVDRSKIEQLNSDISRLIEGLEKEELDIDTRGQILIDSIQHLQRLLVMASALSPRLLVTKTTLNCPYAMATTKQPCGAKKVTVALNDSGNVKNMCPNCNKPIGIEIS